jgi:hypothetical protein
MCKSSLDQSDPCFNQAELRHAAVRSTLLNCLTLEVGYRVKHMTSSQVAADAGNPAEMRVSYYGRYVNQA